MMGIVIGFPISLVWRIFNGLTLLLANRFANFMWRLSSKDLTSRMRAILLYIGLQVGGILIIGVYIFIVFAILDSSYSSMHLAESLVTLFTSIFFIFVSFKKKWFRPSVTTLNEFLHSKPPKIYE